MNRGAATLWMVGLLAASPAGGATLETRAQEAVARGVKFLRGWIDADGRCKKEFPPAHRQYGGMTALCAYALASAGVEPTDGQLRKALAWLRKTELKSTYAVALRACAMSALNQRSALPVIQKDVRWLVAAANCRGGYTYLPQGGRDTGVFDNSNTQMALLAVAAGAEAGADVPEAYWRRLADHWRRAQQPDGGWGYAAPRGSLPTKTYGSMTAAALASLYACFDRIPLSEAGGAEASRRHKPVDGGLEWLRKHYSVRENPKLGLNRYYYWMYCLGRVGAAGGRKTLAGHDWYAEGVGQLLRRQRDDGSWGLGRPVRQTCFALLFLARARDPILFFKLRHRGRWNRRPRDLAGLTRWMARTFERPFAWQIIDFDAPPDDWAGAPIVYLSGTGPLEFSDAQVLALRTFALRGGLIVSEAADNNADFTLDMRKLYRRIFPRRPLRRLPDDHPVYGLHFKPEIDRGLAGVSNGVRMLAIHCPRELSRAFEAGPAAGSRAVFELGANLALLATDRTLPRLRATRAWPAAAAGLKPVATIRVARVRHAGNDDPEPLAWPRMARWMARHRRIRLDVAEPMPPAALDAATWPVAAMTGTGAFTLTPKDAAHIERYLQAGGTLVIDAAGGDRPFSQAVRRHVLPLLTGGASGPIHPDHAIFREPEPIAKLRYRRALSRALADRQGQLRLVGVVRGARLAVVFSPDDLISGMLGSTPLGVRGYAPETARALMANILSYAAKVPAPAKRK